MYTDPIADYLTRIRNASNAKHRFVEIPYSKIKEGITKVLLEMGYILNYKHMPEKNKGILKIALKYDSFSKRPTISKITRISTPGLRKYTNVNNIPRVMNGLGICVLSTSMGIMSGKQAKHNNVGGEILCFVE